MVQKSTVRNTTLVVITFFVLSGCANMPEWAKNEALQGGILSAAVCGGAVALLGGDREEEDREEEDREEDRKENRKKIIGAAAICGALGAIAGDMLKKRREQYASDEDFYNQEIGKAQQFNAEKKRYKTQLATDISHLRIETAQLVSLQKQGKASQQSLTAQKTALKNKQAEVKTVIKQMKDESAFQNALYAKIKKQDPTDPRLATLEKEVKKLQQAITEVEAQQTQLADLDDDLV